jgi:hypothetical protein
MPPDFELTTKNIGELSGTFRIKSYQRGYRWRKEEVSQLLDDIYSNSVDPERKSRYCLQPVVVMHDKKSGGFELVDGQQRLTTIRLLLHYLKHSELPKLKPKFTISYETRQHTEPFFADPTNVDPESGIDAWFIVNAYRRIEKWFDDQIDPTQAAIDLHTALNKSVYVIWYLADRTVVVPEELFARLNADRIRLTSAELVKALLLMRKEEASAGSDKARAESLRQTELASQWDLLEHDLRDDAFWAFLTNEPAHLYPTRIELLLLWTAGRAERDPKASEYAVFEWFVEELKKEPEREGARRADELWEKVVALHQLLRDWYTNNELYHRIGFLLHDGTSGLELVAEGRALAKSVFRKGLTARIRKRLDLSASDLRSLSYEQPEPCNRALVLFNVETVRSSPDPVARFPFAAHKSHRKWSLEHIHARQCPPLKGEGRWRAWLEMHLGSLHRLGGLDEARRDQRDQLRDEVQSQLDGDKSASALTEVVYSDLRARMLEFFGEAGEGEEVHAISNLALLERDDNSALGNAEFDAKRLKVIEMETRKYVPVCTRRVFGKFYSESIAGHDVSAGSLSLQYWGRDDREAYLKAMTAALSPFLKQESA